VKKFYTEKDIDDLFKSGARSLRVDDTIALTDLAYEKAKQLGLQLLSDGAQLPTTANVPIRPYLSDASLNFAAPLRATQKVDSVSPAVTQPALAPAARSQNEKGSDVSQRIRSAVLARLGNQVDAKLLDVIIQRVVKSTGVK
jgi:hypothetical protein